MKHELYETYAALHASGQLAHREHEDFERHVAECSSCRKMACEFASISVLMFSEKTGRHANLSAERLERFRERALREGVLIGGRSTGMRPSLVGIPICIFLIFTCFAYMHARHMATNAEQNLQSPPLNGTYSPAVVSFVSEDRTATIHVHVTMRRRKAPATARKRSSFAGERLTQDFARLIPAFQPLTWSDRKPFAGAAPSRVAFQHISVPDRLLDSSDKTIGAAALEYPDSMGIMQPHNFAADMRQLHFRLPTTP